MPTTDAATYATLTAWIDKFGMAGADRELDTSRSTLQYAHHYHRRNVTNSPIHCLVERSGKGHIDGISSSGLALDLEIVELSLF